MTDSKSVAAKAGLQRVSDITSLRLKKVLNQIKASAGFRILRLSDSAFTQNFGNANEHILKPKTLVKPQPSLDAALEIFVKLGIKPSERIQDLTVHDSRFWLSGRVAIFKTFEYSAECVEQLSKIDVNVLVAWEDGFENADDLKANIYFACKKANISFKTF